MSSHRNKHRQEQEIPKSPQKSRRNNKEREPALLNSPQKSVGSYVSENDEEEVEDIVLEGTKHSNLLEPPPKFDIGDRKRSLDDEQLGDEVPIPNCCTKSIKAQRNHKHCIAALGNANETIIVVQTLACKLNTELISTWNLFGNKIKEFQDFTKKQYNAGAKIVNERNKQEDKVRGQAREAIRLKGDITESRDDVKKLRRKIKSPESTIE